MFPLKNTYGPRGGPNPPAAVVLWACELRGAAAPSGWMPASLGDASPALPPSPQRCRGRTRGRTPLWLEEEQKLWRTTLRKAGQPGDGFIAEAWVVPRRCSLGEPISLVLSIRNLGELDVYDGGFCPCPWVSQMEVRDAAGKSVKLTPEGRKFWPTPGVAAACLSPSERCRAAGMGVLSLWKGSSIFRAR